MTFRQLCATLSCVLFCVRVSAQPPGGIPGVRASLTLRSFQVTVAKPVWGTFSIENTSEEPITLTVPGCEPEIPSPEMGLPISHVFSGGSSSGVVVETEAGRRWDKPAGYRKPARAAILMIAPSSTVGTTVDLREYFPALRAAGRYRITWSPYGGAVSSGTVMVAIAPLKQVELATDAGTLTLQLFYEDAPASVANFIELVQTGFYAGKTFHRLAPGYLLQGGCSRGDGTGIRPDGKLIPPEFNQRPHKKGSVSMALLDDDPSSASCQFFICNTRVKDWDGRYTVFAQLVGDESFATLERLMASPTNQHGTPERTLTIRHARLGNAPASASPFGR